MHPLLRVGTRPGHYTLLLISLLLLLLASALVGRYTYGPAVFHVMFGMTLIASTYRISTRRRFIISSICLAMVTFIALSMSEFGDAPPARLIALASGFLFFQLAALLILVTIMTRTRISTDELAGAVSAYLLIGISGAFVFAFIDQIEIGSIVNTVTIHAVPNNDLWRFFSEYLYFSFTCLTTLGFGDLVPATPISRVFAYLEAVIGQVYLTVLVARLVGLHLSYSRRDAD